MAYVCRLCLGKNTVEDYLMLTEPILAMIQFCVPEFKSQLTFNPLLCKQCHKALETMFAFKCKIIKVQKKIFDLVDQKEGNMIINLDALSESDSENANRAADASPVDIEMDDIIDESSESEKSRASSVQDDNVMDVNNTLSRMSNDNDELLNLLNGIIGSEVDTSKQIEHEKSKDEISATTPTVKSKEFKSAKNINQKSSGKLSKNKPAYHCFSCKCKYTVFRDLIKHEYQNHSVGKYKCSLCAFQCISSDVSTLQRHYTNFHRKITSFTSTCIFCNYSSNKTRNLGEHLKKKHTNIIKHGGYFCDMCCYSTHTYRMFIKHYCETHSGMCNVCKVMLEPKELNEHLRLHYEEGAVECTTCAKVCLGHSGLEQHMKIHIKVQNETLL